MKKVTTLDKHYLYVNILKLIPKYTIKKQNIKCVAAISTLICRPIFFTLVLKNIFGLESNE